MKLPIYMYGHPVLRKTAEPISADYPELKTLVENMFETMYHSEGVGLAAPQIGLNIQLVVIDGEPVAETFPECQGQKMVLVNPEIQILDGDKVSRSEGCLSLPGIGEEVKRVEHISLSWLEPERNADGTLRTDADGRLVLVPQQKELSGFASRIVQHECDHLEGKVFIDHISPIRKQLIKRKLNNIVEGKAPVDYPAKWAPKRRK